MKPFGFLERLLFGREALRRAEEAERRLQAAITDREQVRVDTADGLRSLHAAVREVEAKTRRVTSSPPPVTRFILPSESDLEPDPRGSR